jgi:hypothetical protein
MSLFECIPVIQIGQRLRARVLLLKRFNNLRIKLEAQKRKLLLIKERRDFPDGKPVLHDVEEHVATAAHTVEVDVPYQNIPARLVSDRKSVV